MWRRRCNCRTKSANLYPRSGGLKCLRTSFLTPLCCAPQPDRSCFHQFHQSAMGYASMVCQFLHESYGLNQHWFTSGKMFEPIILLAKWTTNVILSSCVSVYFVTEHLYLALIRTEDSVIKLWKMPKYFNSLASVSGTTTRLLVRTSLCNTIFCDFGGAWCPYFPLRHGRSYHHQWSVSWLLTKPNCRGKQRRPENLLKSNDYWIQMTYACTHLNSSSFLIGFRSLILQNRRENKVKQAEKEKETKEKAVRRLSVFCLSHLLFDLTPDSFRPQTASSLFLAHNTALVPPYRILIDTNFINFSLQNKLELVSGMMDCLYAKCRRIHS